VGQNYQLVYEVAGSPVVCRLDQARIVLGRSIVCDVVFDSPHLSRKHAEIVREGDAWILQDLRSRFGVAVNGERIVRKQLAVGDRIVLAPESAAPTCLEFRPAEAAGQPPPQPVHGNESGSTSVIASIDLRALSSTLEQASGHKDPAVKLHPADMQSGDLYGNLVSAAGVPGRAFEEASLQLPVLSMFKSAGEILLAHRDLDDLLQQVVSLVGLHLPGRRCVACLVDPATGEIEPCSFSHGPPRPGLPGRSGPAPRMPAGLAEQSPFLVSRSILHEAVRVKQAMLVACPGDDPRFNTAVSIRQMGIRSAICVPLYHQGHVAGLIYADSPGDAGPLDGRDLEVLTVLGLMVAAGIAQISLRNEVDRQRALRDRLARYNSPRVVDQIMKLTAREENKMLAEEHDVSVLFADLTGFSALAEDWTAAETVQVLNLVFERLTVNVFERDGTLDKYIGDAVMAVFGAPLPQADHARRALDTALAMQRTLDDLNRRRPPDSALRLRIGINSGRVIAGDIGSPLHKAYTVVGDVVNIASRLETTIAQPGQIVIGEATYELVRNHYECESLGELPLRGKRQLIRAYRLVGEKV
jgi:adenylate cyclase